MWAAGETREGVWQEERGWKVEKAAVFLWPGLLCSTQRGLVWYAAWTPQSWTSWGPGVSAFSRSSQAKGAAPC